MVSFIAANTVALQRLRRELRLVEQRQIQHYGTNAVTNVVMAPFKPATTNEPIR
jgi:hypothetical protein